MLLSEFVIPTITSMCICGSVFIINNHCIKREKAENQRNYIILTEETYNSITDRSITDRSITSKQPNSQKYPQYQSESITYNTHPPPPTYNEISNA